MIGFARIGAALTLGLLGLVPIAADAQTQQTFSIYGSELPFATPTEGTFTGVATTPGALPTQWAATVRHGDISSGSAGINGGTFCLGSVSVNISFANHTASATCAAGSVQGYFAAISPPDGGIIQLSGFGSSCSNQTYSVRDSLTADPTGLFPIGSFNAILTHYRVFVWWTRQCVTYFATVVGTATLNS